MTEGFVLKFFLINCLSHFTRFWDWIKCRVSDGLLYRLSLETAVRLINQFSKLFPSYNAHKVVPFIGYRRKIVLFIASWSPIKFSEKVYHLQSSSSYYKKQTQTFVFRHILKYVIFWSESKNTFRYFCVIVDLRSSKSSSSLSSSNSKTNTNFCVYTYSEICYFRVELPFGNIERFLADPVSLVLSSSEFDWKKLPFCLCFLSFSRMQLIRWLEEFFAAWK